MYKKSCFTSQNYRFILNLRGKWPRVAGTKNHVSPLKTIDLFWRWLEVVGGGWLEGPEKTIDLGKSLGEGFIFYNILLIFDHLEK